MSNHEALRQAAGAYATRNMMTKQQRYDTIVALGEWGLFSIRQIASIMGAAASTVSDLTPKSDRTGGRFHPDALPHLLEIVHREARGEPGDDVVAEALTAGTGTSVYMAAKLSGVSPQKLKTRYKRATAHNPRKETNE